MQLALAGRKKSVRPPLCFTTVLCFNFKYQIEKITLSISSAWMKRQECASLQPLWQDSRPRDEPEKIQI